MLKRRDLLLTISALGLTGLARDRAHAWQAIKVDDASVLLVIDVQNCFLPGGTLPVSHGDEIVPVINSLSKLFTNIILTQDWHPSGHASFASSHPGKHAFETIELGYGTQILWPDHCVQGTDDAALSGALSIPRAELIIRKGFNKSADSYSAFADADGVTTGLADLLRARKLSRVFIVGLATDFCVASSALDARKAGFDTYVIEDACRGIDTAGSLGQAWAKMTKAGVKRIQSSELA